MMRSIGRIEVARSVAMSRRNHAIVPCNDLPSFGKFLLMPLTTTPVLIAFPRDGRHGVVIHLVLMTDIVAINPIERDLDGVASSLANDQICTLFRPDVDPNGFSAMRWHIYWYGGVKAGYGPKMDRMRRRSESIQKVERAKVLGISSVSG